MTKNHHEVIICGAGMIGLTFALLMAEKKIKVCIIDKNDKRTYYLHNKIIEQLLFLKDLIESSENLGIWKKIKK